MELVLPKNYVEVTEEEKMYLDGGDVKSFIYGAVATVLGAVVSKAVSQSLLGAMISRAYAVGVGWLVNQINSAIYIAILNPGAAIGVGLIAVGALATVYFVGKNNR